MAWYKQGWSIIVLYAWFSTAVAAPSISQLLKAQEFQQAYELAQKLEAEYAGEVSFDFLYGLAAIESGHPEAALFPLERVLMAQSYNHRAKLELARAYFLLGDHTTARQLFNEVLTYRPPQKVQQNVQRYLEEIESRNAAAQHRVSGYVELNVGSDSNINSATPYAGVAVPGLGNVSLDESNSRVRGEFIAFDGGIEYFYLMRKDIGLFVAASLQERLNIDYDEFNLRTFDSSAGLIYKKGEHTIQLPLQFQQSYVDGERFRTLLAVGGEWSWRYTPRQQLLGFTQFGGMRHADQDIRDVDLLLGGIGWSYRLEALPVTLSSSYYSGIEDAVRAAGLFNGREYSGWQLGVEWQPLIEHTVKVSLSSQGVNHQEKHPVFGRVRGDTLNQVFLDWRWRYQPNWVISSELTRVDNSSNIDLYQYDRAKINFAVMYSF